MKTVVEWFPTGGQQMAPADARAAWNTLEHGVARGAGHPDWALLRLPASTGLNLWLDSIPDSYDLPPCDPDIGAEIQGSEPQHRIGSYLDSSRCRCDACVALLTSKAPLDGFAYADGRFMYHGAPPKELGGGPGVRMRAQEAQRCLRPAGPNTIGVDHLDFPGGRTKDTISAPRRGWNRELGKEAINDVISGGITAGQRLQLTAWVELDQAPETNASLVMPTCGALTTHEDRSRWRSHRCAQIMTRP